MLFNEPKNDTPRADSMTLKAVCQRIADMFQISWNNENPFWTIFVMLFRISLYTPDVIKMFADDYLVYQINETYSFVIVKKFHNFHFKAKEVEELRNHLHGLSWT